jgi:hypothetical protein
MAQKIQSAIGHTVSNALHSMPDVLCDLIAEYSRDTIRKVFSKTHMPSYELNDQKYELKDGSIYNSTNDTIVYHDGKIDVFIIAEINNTLYFIINAGYESRKFLMLLDRSFNICFRHWSYTVSDLYAVNDCIFTGIRSSIEKYILQLETDRYTGKQSMVLKCKGGILSPYNMHAVKIIYKNTVVTYNYVENCLEFYKNDCYKKSDCINISVFEIPQLTWAQSHYTRGPMSCMAAEDITGNLLVYINGWLLTIQQTNKTPSPTQNTSDHTTPHNTTPHNTTPHNAKTKYQVIRVLKYTAENLYKI